MHDEQRGEWKRHLEHKAMVRSLMFFLGSLNATKMFACNEDSYIAQPTPLLLQGVAMLAQCAYHDQPQVLEAIANLNTIALGDGFQKIDFPMNSHGNANDNETPAPIGIGDTEDTACNATNGFAQLHNKACQE